MSALLPPNSGCCARSTARRLRPAPLRAAATLKRPPSLSRRSEALAQAHTLHGRLGGAEPAARATVGRRGGSLRGGAPAAREDLLSLPGLQGAEAPFPDCLAWSNVIRWNCCELYGDPVRKRGQTGKVSNSKRNQPIRPDICHEHCLRPTVELFESLPPQPK